MSKFNLFSSLFVVLIAFLSSCSNSQSNLKSVYIEFNEYISSGEKTYSYSSEDSEVLEKMNNLITSQKAKLYKCSYDGSITLNYEDETIYADFNTSESCTHLVYLKNDDLVSRKMSEDGVKFLRDLREKLKKEQGN